MGERILASQSIPQKQKSAALRSRSNSPKERGVLFAVTWKRAPWNWPRTRHFRRLHNATSFYAKLRDGNGDFKPLVSLKLEAFIGSGSWEVIA